MASIDQQRVRRGRTGLIAHDPDRAFQRYTLFTSMLCDGKVYADYLLEVTTRGETVWEWRSWEHLDFDTEIITLQDRREEWTHGNTVAELSNGDLVVSFRNISTVAIIDRATGAVRWMLGG